MKNTGNIYGNRHQIENDNSKPNKKQKFLLFILLGMYTVEKTKPSIKNNSAVCEWPTDERGEPSKIYKRLVIKINTDNNATPFFLKKLRIHIYNRTPIHALIK